MVRKRWRWRPGGLYWRLTVSYFLVTLVAVLIVEAATVLLPLIQEYQQFNTSPPLDLRLETQEAPKIVPYLQPPSPDRAGLASQVLIPLLYSIAGDAESHISQAVILDGNGQPLVAATCTWAPRPAAPVGDCTAGRAVPGDFGLAALPVQKGIQNALTGAERSAIRVGHTNSSDVTVIVPVQDPAGHMLGALVTVLHGLVAARVPITGDSTSLSSLGDLFRAFLSRFQPTGLAFLLLATALGTLTGVLISRNLTRRLQNITRAADAWSRGEFEVGVPDRGRDEVGQLARDLNRMAAQIRTLLAARQELAVVEERNRLARELHDSVKQQVFAGALLVRAAGKLVPSDPRAALGHLAEAEALADQVQQELVDLIRALRPAALAGKGLATVLREYAGDWSRRTGIAVEVRVQGERTMALDVEEALFRVAQEALANAARHSGAQALTVRLAWAEAQVDLTVEDNGHGFDVQAAAGQGQGLANMRERMAALGGRLEVAGAAGGTRLVAGVPLAAAPFAPPVESVTVAL